MKAMRMRAYRLVTQTAAQLLSLASCIIYLAFVALLVVRMVGLIGGRSYWYAYRKQKRCLASRHSCADTGEEWKQEEDDDVERKRNELAGHHALSITPR